MIDEILHEAQVLRVAMVDQHHRPYLLPFSFGYQQNSIFIHSAPEGTKLDILRDSPEVCFEVDIRTEIHQTEQACGWSMKYFSVVGFGKVSFLSDIDEKRHAVQCIMKKYSGKDDWEIPESALAPLTVWRIDITSITGKKSKYEAFEPR